MIRFASLLLAGLMLLPFTVTTAAAKATSSAPQVHVVKQGDSLYEIGRKHGLTVKELKRLNGLSSNRLKLGQKLALTKAAAPPERSRPVEAPNRARIHPSMALSSTSNTMWCKPEPSEVSPIYIPGRLRTASRPSSIFMLEES